MTRYCLTAGLLEVKGIVNIINMGTGFMSRFSIGGMTPLSGSDLQGQCEIRSTREVRQLDARKIERGFALL